MRLYRLGDTGEPVRDIQDRLAALGHEPDDDPRGEYGLGTVAAVRAFQEDRGLGVDGIVGPDTWRSLYEAGYRLGDRLLFLRRPMLRGDDIAELQSRLNALGFDAGKADGIFGPDTQRGVIDFQANRDLAADGTAGPEVITELRLIARGPIRAGREALREREWLRSLPLSVAGSRVFFDPAAGDAEEARTAWATASTAALSLQELGGLPVISRSADASVPERLRARRANGIGADIVVSFHRGENLVYYFESSLGRSEAGARLATQIAAELGVEVAGRATAILRETRAPAVVISATDLGPKTGEAVVQGLDRFFRDQAKNRR